MNTPYGLAKYAFQFQLDLVELEVLVFKHKMKIDCKSYNTN